MAITTANAGTGNSTTSNTTLAFNCGANFAVGEAIVVAIAADNAGASGATSLSSVTDAKGNQWELIQATYDPGAVSAGATVGLAWANITRPLVTTDQITITFSANTTAKAAAAVRVVPDVGRKLSRLTSAFTAGAATGTPTITTSSITSGDLVFGVLAAETNAAITADADTTNGTWSTQITDTGNTGTVATSMRVASQNKVVTATATQTYNPTLTSADVIIGWVSFTQLQTSFPPLYPARFRPRLIYRVR